MSFHQIPPKRALAVLREDLQTPLPAPNTPWLKASRQLDQASLLAARYVETNLAFRPGNLCGLSSHEVGGSPEVWPSFPASALLKSYLEYKLMPGTTT